MDTHQYLDDILTPFNLNKNNSILTSFLIFDFDELNIIR